MSGRGDGRLFHPSPNPTVAIGLTLTTSSPTFDPTFPDPFYLIVNARILISPRPAAPIVLATHLNALGSHTNRSFSNITCTSPKTSTVKQIEIYPRSWPHYIWDPNDLRKSWEFVTIPANGGLVVKHELSRKLLSEAGVKKGEKYRVSLTNICLGTRWWTFGFLEDFNEDIRFGQWTPDEGLGEGVGEDEHGRFFTGEKPDDLALVIEDGQVEFEIAQGI